MRVITNPVSPHTCLGHASDKCKVRYGLSHREQKP
ncbi:FhaB filamentous hemagglutinin protein (fragment 2) [Bartonella tribocorum CIP 105476]|uniref:FhaB filamentous hemagglutinin protein (Fragment 2) n=1 Tax=Bartonella tribocorum (strain DSM 28219 / CCUG 45778 / CIP 105476 / IBS 506) TaxID=382640 RepID=A9IZ85_BART1|nr:FhaB filamentous hemagglutinin protein (fragment 2) [Bartonella tribocorum CIP 105476]